MPAPTDQQAAAAGAPPPSRMDDASLHDAPAAASPYTCKAGDRCPVYQAIRVAPADDNGVHRITMHGEHVATFAPWEAGVFVMGLHIGAHIEARQWRWAVPSE